MNGRATLGRKIVAAVRRSGQSAQDALTLALLCLRWYAKREGLSFSQSIDQSWTQMIHDRVNRGKE